MDVMPFYATASTVTPAVGLQQVLQRKRKRSRLKDVLPERTTLKKPGIEPKGRMPDNINTAKNDLSGKTSMQDRV
jgi:hypothetical protein